MIYLRYIKRSMDLLLSILALFFFSPLFLLLAVLVRLKLGSPVIFKQQRPGRNGNIFTMYKFRSMTDKKDENGQLLSDELRLTRFGRLLRSTSLDELPELINILKGNMSFVGPRPLLVQYLSLYNAHQRRRHEVRPGLTGLAQISGRNSIGWEEKFNLDIEYVDNVRFVGDLKIIFLTIKKVFIREGINTETGATVEPFKATPKEDMSL
ncbi:sugar transferase [Cohnella sp. GbtcB17]|uniref:sugar transferase n=1 Tax=Cohnella sp. GbtcB17 TaxID=2824762 RepID=UPI0027D2247D|nr:sugar transferase [Cohnella sp. GbtcB17]